MIFHRRVWYRTLSLCYACIPSSGIILIPWATFVQNFVSFVASIAELAHGNKSRTQSLTQLIWCPGNQTLNFGTVPLLERHVPEDDADCNLLYTGKRLQHYRLQIMCKKFFKITTFAERKEHSALWTTPMAPLPITSSSCKLVLGTTHFKFPTGILAMLLPRWLLLLSDNRLALFHATSSMRLHHICQSHTCWHIITHITL